MNRKLSLLILFFVASGGVTTNWLFAQTADDLNEGTKLEYDGTNEIWRLKWWSRAGNTYFMQHSEDLVTWNWVPAIEAGGDSVKEWGFISNGDRFFMRLQHTDIPSTDPENDDFDGDGFSNLEEILAGSHPFDVANTPQTPDAPLHIDATFVFPHSVLITWAPVHGAAEYLIERQGCAGEWVVITTVENSTLSFLDEGISASHNYHYRVTAINAAGASTSTQTPSGSGSGGVNIPDLSADPEGDWDSDGVINRLDPFPHITERWNPGPFYAMIELSSIDEDLADAEVADIAEGLHMVLIPNNSNSWACWSPNAGLTMLSQALDPESLGMGDFSINSAGTVFGNALHDDEHTLPAIWVAGSNLPSPLPMPDISSYWTERELEYRPEYQWGYSEVMSDAGHFVGRGQIIANDRYGRLGSIRAVLYWGNSGLTPVPIQDPATELMQITGVNNAGTVIGARQPSGTTDQRTGFIGSTLVGFMPLGINTEGTTVGKSFTDHNTYYLRNPSGDVTMLPNAVWIYSLNDSRDVLGISTGNGDTLWRYDSELEKHEEIPLLETLPENTSFSHALKLLTSSIIAVHIEVYSRPALLLPIDIAVDANRDGLVEFGRDTTTAEKPFRFWINEDFDHGEDDDYLSGDANSSDSIINGIRDLEDIVQIKFRIPQMLVDMAKAGTAQLGFKWKDVTSDAPSVRIWSGSPDQDSIDYLKDNTVAFAIAEDNNLSTNSARLVTGTSSVWLRDDLMTDATGDTVTLLMEGVD